MSKRRPAASTAFWNLSLLGHRTLDMITGALRGDTRLDRLPLVRYIVVGTLGLAVWGANMANEPAPGAPVQVVEAGVAWRPDLAEPPAGTPGTNRTELALAALEAYTARAARDERQLGIDGQVLLAAAVWEAELAGAIDVERAFPLALGGSALDALDARDGLRAMTTDVLARGSASPPVTRADWIAVFASYYPHPSQAAAAIEHRLRRYHLG